MNRSVSAVEAHYEKLLGSRYTRMMGGASACLRSAQSLLQAADISGPQGSALDLGAGGGYHARALAERGFHVVAVDSSPALLEELSTVCQGREVTAVLGDVLDDSAYRAHAPFASILCVGDTLTHLRHRTDVDTLLERCATLLAPEGKLVLQFREQAVDLPPENCTFTTLAEQHCLMECVLHFQPDYVWVTDLVHEWTGERWQSIHSTYSKLRLTASEVIDGARRCGLELRLDDIHARQRLLVFQQPRAGVIR